MEHKSICFIHECSGLYLSRATDILSSRRIQPPPNELQGFARQNMSAFLHYQEPEEIQPPDSFSVGGHVFTAFQKPSLDRDPATQVPFQVLRANGTGPLEVGDAFQLRSLEPGLWFGRRLLAPINRQGPLSYADTWDEVAYVSQNDAQFSTYWRLAPGSTIAQASSDDLLTVLLGNLCVVDALWVDSAQWTLEPIPLERV